MERSDGSREFSGTLTGVRVLDFGRFIAAPYCAEMLGYLGADVIRIEQVDGNTDRYVMPVTDDGEVRSSCR